MTEEAQILLDHFRGFVGKFLDMGAGDGKIRSNTYPLLEQGWAGVHVEPSWRTVAAYQANMTGREDKVRLIQAAVVPEAHPSSGLVTYWDNPEAQNLSTCSTALQARGIGRENARPITVGAVTVAGLLVAFPGPFHAVSIDVEGLSVQVLSEFPLDRTETMAVVVECYNAEVLGEDEFAAVWAWAVGNRWSTIRTAENLVLLR